MEFTSGAKLRLRAGISCVLAALVGCGDDSGGASASTTATATATATATVSATSDGNSTANTESSGTAGSTGNTGTSGTTGTVTTGTTALTASESDTVAGTTTGSTSDATDTLGTTEGSSSGTTGDIPCEAQIEICDALDNNCNDLYDEGCDCTPPDLDLSAIEGYTARVVFNVSEKIGAYGRLGDVERALGEYWSDPGEGVLFTVNDAANTAGGIGRMTQDGEFAGWVVDPSAKKLPPNPYLEYGYGGVLYSCTTVAGNWIYKIYPDGTVETVVQHGNCEGIIYGDRGDGVERLYASNYSTGTVHMIEEDGTRTQLAQGLKVVVDLAIPPADSAFKPGLYTINQTIDGVHRIAPDDAVSLDYPYSLGYGIGEEMSFAAPKSAFRDHFYHLSATLQAVVRVKPDGTWEKVITGPKLNYGLYSTGAVFSSNGAYYFFTNEDDLVMRLQACNAVGQ